jgi:hypothetical protein
LAVAAYVGRARSGVEHDALLGAGTAQSPRAGRYPFKCSLRSGSNEGAWRTFLSVNLVSAVFERDTDVWLRMLRSIRCEVVAEAARQASVAASQIIIHYALPVLATTPG